jgi:hypothetical protein
MLSPAGLATDEDGRKTDKAGGAPKDLVSQVKTAEDGGGRDGKAGHLSLAIKGQCQFQEQGPGDLDFEAFEKILRSNGLCEPIGGVFPPD